MHAYLIIAHKNEEQLKKLLRLLDYPENEIFIHVDMKAPPEMRNFNYGSCCKDSNINLYSKYNIAWGSISLIKCELFLMEMASKVRKYQYYHLISGLDLPLRTQKEIHEFFLNNSGKEFIHFANINGEIGTLANNMAKYYWGTRWYNILPCRKSLSIMRKLDTMQVKLQRIIGINRLNNWGIRQLYKGSNWFSITDQLVRDVLKEKELILKIFAAGNCCDEVFLQTYVKTHNEYERLLYHPNMDDDYESIKRAIDWNRGGPYIWRDTDYDELMNSDFLFARKFDATVDENIIDHICQTILKKL